MSLSIFWNSPEIYAYNLGTKYFFSIYYNKCPIVYSAVPELSKYIGHGELKVKPTPDLSWNSVNKTSH